VRVARLQDGLFRAISPSGASTGMFEAHEQRDGGDRYMGKGVLGAVSSINNEYQALIGMDATDQEALDAKMIEMDGTPNKEALGANAVLGISMAACKAGAAAKGVPLWQHFADLAGNGNPDTMPVPCFNVINGGEHAGNKLAFQEFFVIPTGADTFSESMQIGCEVFHNLKKVIKGKFGGDATLIGDEGGFAPPCVPACATASVCSQPADPFSKTHVWRFLRVACPFCEQVHRRDRPGDDHGGHRGGRLPGQGLRWPGRRLV
jgi:enolase